MEIAEMEQVLLSEMLQWYRFQRHDFFNHWQVIMGNLQLNRPERALTYMKEMLVGFKDEQRIFHICQIELVVILLGFVIQLRQEGINAVFDFPEEMGEKSFWKDHWREEYAEALYEYTQGCLKGVPFQEDLGNLEAEIYLHKEEKGFSCRFIVLSENSDVLLDKRIRLAGNFSIS